ncbi:MAG TPA: type II secretion system protein GspJ [Tepidisphaeraceae bacterium]|jgi:type II secretion system protein J
MNKRRAGFSLLELTLAMTIAAMLALTMYAAMSFALRARKNTNASVDRMRSANVAMEVLTQDFQNILPPTGILSGAFIGTKASGPNGDADTIEYYCIGRDPELDDQPMGEGVRRVDLLVRTDANPPMLVRQVQRNLLPTVAGDPDEEVLCRNVRSFSLQYFDGLSWLDDWDSTAQGDVLPLAVAMTLELEPPDANAMDPRPVRVTRVIQLSCAKPPDAMTTGGAP